jgi:hypothetical protein
MARSKLARRSETFEILDEMLRSMSKDERDWFTRFVRRVVRRHVPRVHVPRIPSMPSVHMNWDTGARLLRRVGDIGLEEGLGMNSHEVEAIVRNPSRTGASRALIIAFATALRYACERVPQLGQFLSALRRAESVRRQIHRFPGMSGTRNPAADSMKAAFRRVTGTTIHAYLQHFAATILNVHVLRYIPNRRINSLGMSVRDAVHHYRLWIISRFLYFYGLRNGNSAVWSWS